VDDYDFYLDETGEENDLDKAMFQFSARVDPIESELFNTIYLVMEYLHEGIKYLIEISINRKHVVGEYPITINVNGVLDEFRYDAGQPLSQFSSKFNEMFPTSSSYSNLTKNHKDQFDVFLDELSTAAKKFIKVDNVRKKSEIRIIRPRKRISQISEIRHERFAQPVFYGYYGFDYFFYYTWFWGENMFDNNLFCSDCTIIDEIGNPVMKIGTEGFYAGEFQTLNPSSGFEAPLAEEIEYFPENEYSEELNELALLQPSEISDNTDDTEESETDFSNN